MGSFHTQLNVQGLFPSSLQSQLSTKAKKLTANKADLLACRFVADDIDRKG